MNYARIGKSNRLQVLYRALERAGKKGLTTAGLIDATASVAPHSDVAELRANGYEVSCKYEARTSSGRRIYRYRLLGARP